MRRILERLPPAILIGALVLVLALGGAGYATTTVGSKQIADGSVTSRDIRDGTIRSADISDRTILPRDLSPRTRSALRGPAGPTGPVGPPGAAGPPGSPAADMFAYISVEGTDTATVGYGKGVLGVEQVGVAGTVGELDVTFERDLRDCVVVASAGLGRPRGAGQFASGANAAVFIDPNDAEGVRDNQARVFTVGPTGAPVNTSLLILASC